MNFNFEQFTEYTVPSFDELFMRMVYLVASKSKDTNTKIGAVLVADKRVIGVGYNGMPVGVNDNIPERYERPMKYKFFEHAERNSIFAAAKYGIVTAGSTLYTNGIPCVDCTRAVIQAGIKKIIIHSIWCEAEKILRLQQENNHWKGHNEASLIMCKESGIQIMEFTKQLGIYSYLDGKRFLV